MRVNLEVNKLSTIINYYYALYTYRYELIIIVAVTYLLGNRRLICQGKSGTVAGLQIWVSFGRYSIVCDHVYFIEFLKSLAVDSREGYHLPCPCFMIRSCSYWTNPQSGWTPFLVRSYGIDSKKWRIVAKPSSSPLITQKKPKELTQ